MRKIRKIRMMAVGLMLGVLLAGAALAFLMPWNKMLESQIRQALVRQGFSDVQLRVTGWGWHGVVLEDLRFGAAAPLSFRRVSVEYALDSLRARRLEQLNIVAPQLRIRQIGGKWRIEGMEQAFKVRAGAAPLNVATLTTNLQKLPFDKIDVTQGMLIVADADWGISAPLHLRYRHEDGKITYAGDNTSLRKGGITAVAEMLGAEMTLNPADQSWRGAWHADKVIVAGAATPVPPLHGGGTITAAGDGLSVAGQLQSADKAYEISFRYDHSFAGDRPAVLTVTRTMIPWKEGRLKIADATLPLGQGGDMHVNVQAENISVGELLGALTGRRVQGTGTISGSIPVTLKAGGDIVFHHGALAAAAPGTISMPPDAIPGDNQQIELVRNILSDLRYSSLAMTLDSSPKGDLGILMTVEGHNPAVYNGRPVKLNVNLTGDVLDFIRQNVMLLTRPDALWEQDNGRQTKP